MTKEQVHQHYVNACAQWAECQFDIERITQHQIHLKQQIEVLKNQHERIVNDEAVKPPEHE